MDKDNHIKRGRDQLRIRLKSKGIGDDSVHDLLKIPIEALYAEALREIGEQEAYIDELQNEIKSLKTENKCLRINVDALAQQGKSDSKAIKREELYQQQNARNLALSRRNRELMNCNSELIARIVKLHSELKMLREQLT
jgi:predicted nuclease with TOPRIM domain